MHPLHRPAVVLLHSSASSSRQWQGLVDALESRYRVFAVDLHGHGARPPWPGPAPLSLADEAALVAPILARCGSAHLVGHSYGGAVAIKLATLYPQAVRSIVVYEPVWFRLLIDSGAGPAATVPLELGAALQERMAQGDAAGTAQRFVDFWSGTGAWRSLPGAKQAAIVERMPSVMAQFDALVGESAAPWRAARLVMPRLLLAGGASNDTARRITALLRAEWPDARHETLPGLGHMGPITHAPRVDARIAAFLDAQGPSRRADPRFRLPPATSTPELLKESST